MKPARFRLAHTSKLMAYGVIASALLSMGGCGQDQFSDLRDFMAKAGTTGQKPLESLPAVKPQEVFSYEPSDLPDPFKARSLKPAKGGGGMQPDLSRPKEALEQFPLDGLRMVGTLTKDGQKFALVKTPENTLYRVKKGDHMGQNYGLVIGITDAGLELRETVQDGAGDWAESKSTLALQE
jgi:type IV pilus assembly protein PilP